jgi:hypothetical protein
MQMRHLPDWLFGFTIHNNLQARWIKSVLPPKQLEYAIWLVLATGSIALSGLVLLVLGYVLRSPTLGWTGALVFLTWVFGQERLLCAAMIFWLVVINVESSKQLIFEAANGNVNGPQCVTDNAHSCYVACGAHGCCGAAVQEL